MPYVTRAVGSGLNVGEMRHRVTVQALAQVDDGHNGFTDAWSALHRRVAACVQPLQGRELESARQIDPRISHDITLPYWQAYRDDLSGGRVQLVYHDLADRTFDVVAPPVDIEEKHRWVTVRCKEMA